MQSATPQTDGSRVTHRQQAHSVAARLAGMGFDPYQSDLNRFLVLLGDAPGEIVDLGRPLRSSRLFKSTVRRRDIEIARDFEEYATQTDRSEWIFWNVGIPTQKAAVGNLVEANIEFNRLINLHFSELRKHLDFELLLLAIHPRWDEFSGSFDLHAHFVGRVPYPNREAVRRRLLLAFSKPDVGTDFPVRNPGACATYMVWGVCPYDNVASMPDDALADLWALSQSRARLVRPCGGFREFRRSKTADATSKESKADRARIRANRAATAAPRSEPTGSDKLLAKITMERGGKVIPALLFEEGAPKATERHGAIPREDSSTAIGVLTQDHQEEPKAPLDCSSGPGHDRAAASSKKTASVPIWRRLCRIIGSLIKTAAIGARSCSDTAKAIVRELLGRATPVDDPPP